MGISNFVRVTLLGVSAVLLAGVTVRSVTSQTATAKQATRPYPVTQAKTEEETATLAAGCFWSMEAMYRQIKGVRSVEPGYGGGTSKNPSYEQVGTGTTNHAEAVNIVFDPTVVSFGTLVRVMMTVNDPTTLNKQGADEGTNYRSAIFYRSEAQKQSALEEISKMNASKLWKRPIVTQVVPYSNFYRAEEYHLNYYNRHPNKPYCQNVIRPKLQKFSSKFPALKK